MIILCCCFSRDTYSYGSRVTQILELGVSEFWQLFPTHMLSLEFVLGFCHGIAKGGDCKVEFIQSCVGFILCQFACNSALRNPVFRWESCKGSV